MKDRDIVKSNVLIEATYNPGSVYQMRLLMAALMQIKAGVPMDYRQRYNITANALSDMTGTAARGNYAELKRAADDLMETIVTITTEPDGTPYLPGRKTKIHLVSSCDYFANEGRVELRFTEEILPYVSDLRTRFTQYQAKYVMPMRSSYGIRLYELCLQWLGDEREFEVEEFKRLFDLDKSRAYDRLGNLKSRVIQPALDDINTHSDIRVQFGQRKMGRRVTHFQFSITRPVKHKRVTFEQYVEQHANPGESWEDARQRLRPVFERGD